MELAVAQSQEYLPKGEKMKVNQELKDIIIEEYKKGESVNSIRKKHQIGFQTARAIIAEEVPIKRRPNSISDEKVQEVVDLWNNGVKNADFIAKLTKVSKSRVYNILHTNNLFVKTPCDNVLLIKNAHSQGIPNVKIANMLGVSRQYVSSTLKRYK